ncbi:WSCD family member GA21586-like isoform X3 [Apostichopus japonicus]|uniref:WSCD family member GA21586-like isoform X3 n=1 Tax=Stichopus japonicus TaxID=307972 RepID=UPI003AB4EFE9
MMKTWTVLLSQSSLIYFITLVALPIVMVFYATWEPTFITYTAEQPKYRSHNIERLTSFTQGPIRTKLLHQVAPTVSGISQVRGTEILNVSQQSVDDVPKAILNICQNVTLMPPGSLAVVALASLPGSGNTWLRYLIERVTGIYTGSIYNDRTLSVGAWPKLIDSQLKRWKELIDGITANFADNDTLLLVYFQDLKSDLRTELKRIVEFLELPLNEDRLICTLKNQEGQFHRPHKALPFNPFNAAQQKLIKAAMTKGIKKLKETLKPI